MKIKKCGFLLSLVMLICFAIPSFVSAEEGAKINVLENFDVALRDNDKKTKISIPGNSDKAFKLDKVYKGVSGFYISFENLFTNPLSFKFLLNGVKNYEIALSDRMFNSKEGNFTINYSGSFDEIRISSSGTGSVTDIYELKVFSFAPFVAEDISNLNAIPEVDKVKFTWDNPKSSRFTGVKVYFEGEERFFLNPNATEVISKNLEPDKSYKYRFVAMYGDEESKGVEKVIKTKPKPKEPMPLVKPPENVILTPQNGKMVIAWDNVESPYLEGYNVYIDGKKVNNEPLKSNKLIVKSLENGKAYKVQISAINKENAEGEKSKVKEDKPSVDALEVEYDVKMPFSPMDLITSSVSILALLGGFILLSIVIIWFKPLKNLIVKAARREKDKK